MRLSEPIEIRDVYCSIAAQSDNLGDIEIRRTAALWYSQAGAHLVVYVGTMPDSYIRAFHFPDGTKLVASAFRFQVLLWRAIVGRRASMAFAPGPVVMSGRFSFLVKSAANLLNVMGIKISGGVVVAVGRSFRGGGRLSRFLQRAIIRRCDVHSVRDDASSSVLGMTLREAPDLAFWSERNFQAQRDRRNVVLSFRGDRLVDLAFVEWVTATAKSVGLSVEIVTQVERDNSQHATLAEQLGVSHFAWVDRNHADQHDLVVSRYSNAYLVLSNRLHSLLMGVQAGAVPIAFLDSSSDKLTTTLAPYIPLSCISPGEQTEQNAFVECVTTRPPVDFGELKRRRLNAAEQCEELRQSLIEALRTAIRQ